MVGGHGGKRRRTLDSNRNVYLADNPLDHNEDHGIRFEVSINADIFDNKGWENGWVGLARRGLCVQQRPLLAVLFFTKLHAKCCSRSVVSSKQAGGPFLRS